MQPPDLYKVPHPNYTSDVIFKYYLYLDRRGYKAYLDGQKIPLESIKKETAERRLNHDGV